MRRTRRNIRNCLGRLIGIQADMQVWWTPGLPIMYVSNAKAGCSSIKQSLKAVQARAYIRAGRTFDRKTDPHADDDCLRCTGLEPSRCRDRYLFSCVRNPFTRALSAYLDKVKSDDYLAYCQLRKLQSISFEGFLRSLADYGPTCLDGHFRPQHVNLNYPSVSYDAVFFLENPAAISGFLAQIVPEFEFEHYAPHARGAAGKLAAHYSPTTVQLVREIYARDFEAFGYSRNLHDALQAPGHMLVEHALLRAGAMQPPPPSPLRPSRQTRTLENTLRCRWLIERRLI